MSDHLSEVLVDIPSDKGIHVRSAGLKDEKYVYKYTKYFRNSEGKPRNKAKVIGKFDIESGRMLPNANFFNMYNIHPELPDGQAWAYGYTYAIRKCCRDMGLHDCLREVFGAKTDEIVSVAAFIIREGNSVDGIDDWQDKNLIPGFRKSLTSQSCSRLFESLKLHKLDCFFKKWVKTALTDNDSVCYDVTSISSYSKTMTDIEYGYNRDGDDLPQFNIGMFCGESNKLPLYYNRYNGSLTDKTNLPFVLANAESVGIKNVKLVVDGGFISEDCFKSFYKYCKAVTIGIPACLDISQKMIQAHITDRENHKNRLPDQEIFCFQQPALIHSVNGKLMLYYDPVSHTQLCTDIAERLNALSAELSKLKRIPKNNMSRYAKYFIITKHDNNNGLNFQVRYDDIDKLKQAKGYFLLFTTDLSAKPDDTLYFYRAKDADEKLFDQIKIDMRGSRVRTHNTGTTDGKIFVTFIALAIRAYMLDKFGKYISANYTSLKKVLNKLENIVIIGNSGGKCRFSKALTKQQKEILGTLDAIDDIAASLNSCLL
jgi:hypothetical protein